MLNDLKRILSVSLCIVMVVGGFLIAVNVMSENDGVDSSIIYNVRSIIDVAGERSSAAADQQSEDGTIYNNLSVCASTDSPGYNVGDVVEMKLYVEQLSGNETYNFPDSQRYDFELYKDGVLIWRWSEGKGFLMFLGYVKLSPEDPSRTYYEYWNSTGAEPGIYDLKGMWTCSDPSFIPHDWTQFELEEISADVDVKPESMNNVKHGKFTILLEIPGYNISDIDQESIVLLNSTAQPTKIIMDWDLNRLILKYWRSEACQENGWYTIEGLLNDGVKFRGADYELNLGDDD